MFRAVIRLVAVCCKVESRLVEAWFRIGIEQLKPWSTPCIEPTA